MSRRRVSLLVALALTSCGGGTPTPGKGGGGGRTFDAEGEGGKTSPDEPTPSVPPVPDLAEATASLTPERKQLAETASLVVDRIRDLEIERDVTCWTSFRQLDNFIATKSYSNFATLTKIVAGKALVHGVWAEASKKGGAVLSAADIKGASKIDASLPAEQKPGLDQLAVDLGQQQFKDYRTTSEHWRVVLSIAQDELLSSSPQVKPLSPEAADELALVATRLSLALLTESGEVATLARAPLIEIDHVKSAFTQVKERYGIADVMPASSLDVAGARPALLAITRRLIDAKIEALRRFNKAGEALAPELNKISKLEVTDDGAAELRAKLDHFAEFMARGYEPMRADNYLADGNFADKPLEGKPYIDAEYVENATVQLFPYVMMPNGDVRMRFEARPGTLIDDPIEPQDVTLLDHQMNAVRDTAIHWVVLQDVWGRSPFAMDPFAAEYLSELVSIVGTFWMRRAQTLARANNREKLDGASFAGVEDNRFAMVMPKDDAPHPSWTPAKQKAKATLMRRYGKALFADVSAAWGLPQEVTVAGYGTVGAHSGAQPVGAHSGAQPAGAHSGAQPAGAHSGKQPAGAHSGADAQKPAGAHSGKDAQKPAGAHSGKDAQKPAGAHSGKDAQQPAGAHSGKDAQKPAGAHSGKDALPAGAHSGAAPRVGDLGFDIQKVMGAGIAVGDIDADGDSDLFFSGEGLGRLYLNDDEGGTRKLVDVTAAWGVPADLVDSHHAMFLDHDGDDDLDLLIVRGRSPSLLLDNQDGKLVDVAAKRGLVTGVGAHVASAFDYDEDGDVDVYIGYYGSAACNRGECNGRNLPSVDGRNGSPNQLFRNDGEQYTEVAAAARVADEGWTLASSTFDYDEDGDVDLYLANDFGANPLFRNNGDGTFDDVAVELGAADRGSGMNVSFSDIDDNGSFDVFVANIDMFSKTIKVVFPRDESVVNLTDGILRSFQYLSGNKLYANVIDSEGKRRFEAVEGAWFEPGDQGWGWAGTFFDYENDGDEDIYLANGWIPGSPATDQKNQMYIKDAGTFYLTPQDAPEAFPGNSRAVVAFDADGDGDLDLAVNNYAQPPKLLENVQRMKKPALRIRLRDDTKNTRAIGAVIEVKSGKTVQRRQITCGNAYLGQDDEVVHVGLGSARTADVTITWPDGTKTTHEKLGVGAVHLLQKRG